MTDTPPAQFDWATELSDAQGHVTLSKQEAKEIGARLRSMSAKLKAYEDLGDAADDVQLLRMGYAAARLEIESPHGQQNKDTPHGQVPGERCQHCIDRHDGVYGSWAAPCPYHDDDGKPRPTANAAPQQEAQEPCPTCAALARTVMLDQVSFDRKPDCYGIRQITDDEGVEEWEDIRTSPDVAREEANDMMATGRGEIYEVVPLWTTPKPSPTAQAAESVQDMQSVNDAVTIELPPLPDPDLRDVGTKLQEIKEFLKGYATEYARTAIAARAMDVGEDAEQERPVQRMEGWTDMRYIAELENVVRLLRRDREKLHRVRDALSEKGGR